MGEKLGAYAKETTCNAFRRWEENIYDVNIHSTENMEYGLMALQVLPASKMYFNQNLRA
jgi:hypothetical protein